MPQPSGDGMQRVMRQSGHLQRRILLPAQRPGFAWDARNHWHAAAAPAFSRRNAPEARPAPSRQTAAFGPSASAHDPCFRSFPSSCSCCIRRSSSSICRSASDATAHRDSSTMPHATLSSTQTTNQVMRPSPSGCASPSRVVIRRYRGLSAGKASQKGTIRSPEHQPFACAGIGDVLLQPRKYCSGAAPKYLGLLPADSACR